MNRQFPNLVLVFVGCVLGWSVSVRASYESEVLADNPFVYYRFDETSGEAASDSSGNDRHAEYVDVEYGETSVSDSLGTAIRLDGFASHVFVPALDFESDQLTIETWLNVDFITGRCCTSVFSPDGWQPGWLHYNLGESGRVEFALNSGGPNDRWTFDDELPLEEWAHVVSTYDADEALARIWINSEEVDFDIPDFSSPQTVQLVVDAQIGAWQGSRFLSGAIDEFAIYDSVLSDERIEAHYAAAFSPSIVGDFDGSGELDLADINQLLAEINSGSNDAGFDLTNDAMVTEADLGVWVNDLKNTWVGDANLDGEFNSSDFVTVFSAGKYEKNEVANWSEGDWTGDLRFNSSDFVAAFQSQGYEQGLRPNMVPEPPSCGIVFIIAVGLFAVARRLRSIR
ncbi:MAG: hypothetical protein KDB27_07945 [Planctomycetales bacterium]|nr:hypothetical protein [Planctomycetales bacterium]